MDLTLFRLDTKSFSSGSKGFSTFAFFQIQVKVQVQVKVKVKVKVYSRSSKGIGRSS